MEKKISGKFSHTEKKQLKGTLTLPGRIVQVHARFWLQPNTILAPVSAVGTSRTSSYSTLSGGHSKENSRKGRAFSVKTAAPAAEHFPCSVGRPCPGYEPFGPLDPRPKTSIQRAGRMRAGSMHAPRPLSSGEKTIAPVRSGIRSSFFCSTKAFKSSLSCSSFAHLAMCNATI